MDAGVLWRFSPIPIRIRNRERENEQPRLKPARCFTLFGANAILGLGFDLVM